MHASNTFNKVLLSLAFLCSLSFGFSQMALASTPQIPLAIDYYTDASGQVASTSTPEISLKAGEEFALIIRYDNATGRGKQLRVVIPSGVRYVSSSPAPNVQTEYVFTYETPDGDASQVNIVSIRLALDKSLAEGEVSLASFMQYSDPNYSAYPIAYQYPKVIVTAPTIPATAAEASVGNFSGPSIFLWLIVAILAIILIAFGILDSLLSLPKAHKYPSAVRPTGSGNDKIAILGFSFGLRGIEPGLSNEVMAHIIKEAYPDSLISVQWEIGNALNKLGLQAHHKVMKHLAQPGKYLDTEEVARQMAEFLSAQGDISEILVIAHDEHMPRVLKTLKKFGIHGKPGSAHIPYDPESSQIWTRSPFLFKIRELLAWPIYILKGVA